MEERDNVNFIDAWQCHLPFAHSSPVHCQCRLEKVGWIFTQSNQERDYIMSTPEICQIAVMQDELGPDCVTGVVSSDRDRWPV